MFFLVKSRTYLFTNSLSPSDTRGFCVYRQRPSQLWLQTDRKEGFNKYDHPAVTNKWCHVFPPDQTIE